ncbi:MAG TPA: hypothetical protein VNU92_02795 [Edaphobacter sp.]|jgi:hypothetical protein|nr:hypothetical protein [Edaphobacter sp.]
MALAYRSALIISLLAVVPVVTQAQVFVVGEKTATDGIATDFKPTHVELPQEKLTERGRRELIRNLESEQGFAHRALPMGAGLTLMANGHVSPSPDTYKKMLYEKGQSAGPGDRVIITALDIKGDRIVLDFNGGPYAKHRFLRHIQLNDAPMPVAGDPAEVATGSRIILVFEGGIPEVSGPEVKALLAPLVDFGVKTSVEAYADTLPDPLKEAIAAHEVLVGMNHRMVLAALGPPENKMREQQSGDPNGSRYEEWIYGHVPQTIRFVRFVGDRVTMVEIAALGKPIEIHDTDEMGGFNPGPPTREIALGDQNQRGAEDKPAAPPSLRLPGEAPPPDGPGKVQFPTNTPVAPIPAPPGSESGSSTDPGTNPGIGADTGTGSIPGASSGKNPGTRPGSSSKPPMQ